MTGNDESPGAPGKGDLLPHHEASGGEGEEESGSGLPQFVTPLASIEQQVGTHVTAALQHPDTVAALSTVAMRQDGTQCIVSVGLDAEAMEQVQMLLQSAQQANKRRIPCIGFHCHLKDDDEDEQQGADKEEGTES